MLDFNNRGAGYGVFENGTLIAEYDFVKDTNTPEHSITITSTTPGTASVFQVTLPSWANVEFFDMRLDEGVSMLPYELPVRRRYVAMGDSITHGTGQQSYTHRTYPFKLAEALNVDLLNLAIGGSRVSVPIGEMLSEFPPVDVITILIGYNDCYGSVPLGTYQSNLTALVTACRTNQPNAEIFCITPTYTDDVATNRTDAYRIEDFRLAVSNVVAAGQTAGDTKLHLIRGEMIITNSSQLLDGVHLLPDGAIDMANGLFAAMDPVVNALPDGITHAHDNALIDYDGVLFPKHTNDYVQLNRFSDALLLESEGFNVDRALVPSCVVIRFTSASPTITAHFQTLETDKALKMPQYAVYRNGTTHIADYEEFKFDGSVTNPVFTIVSDSPGTNVMYEILLPSLNATAFRGLTLANGYNLVSNAPYERPVFVAIGDSITMNAGFQSQSYETYTWKFGRARGMEVYNIAVGGATTAPDWGSMFPALNPEFITVLFGINDWNTANDLGIFRTKYMALLDNIRADHPGTPLFCITLVAVKDTVNPIGANGVTVDAFRNEIINMVNERRTAGDSNLYVINGHAFTESADLMDSFHFDQYGTSKFATNLNAAINKILVSSNYSGAAAIPAGTLADWAVPYALDAAVTNYQNDADGDGLDNLVEYALGGNPTNRNDNAAVRPGFQSPGASGTNGIEYVYQRRRNAPALKLNYSVEFCSNLTSPVWSTTGIVETGSGSIDSSFESVSNRVPLSGNTGFVRLRIGTP
jgi:lysophospholipase L1-like esterase